jgi:hypothetical protein
MASAEEQLDASDRAHAWPLAVRQAHTPCDHGLGPAVGQPRMSNQVPAPTLHGAFVWLNVCLQVAAFHM